jgi:membrane-associated phospholipid phosphatase
VRFVGVDKHSFPSGHCTRTSCLAALAAARYPQAAHALYTWTVMIAVARVALGRHYLTDVLAGCVVGLVIIAPMAVAVSAWGADNLIKT